MYKNQIPTPRFQIFEKAMPACEYIRNLSIPCAIKPDNSSYTEGTLFCETNNQAQKIVNDFY